MELLNGQGGCALAVKAVSGKGTPEPEPCFCTLAQARFKTEWIACTEKLPPARHSVRGFTFIFPVTIPNNVMLSFLPLLQIRKGARKD